MKVKKFYQYLKENEESTEVTNIVETPETLIHNVLRMIKKKLESYFDTDSEDNVMKIKQIKSKSDMKLSDFNLRLDSSELSKSSKLNDSLTVKFSDEQFLYTLIVIINIKQGVNKENNEDFNEEDIKKCFIKFKKYDNYNFEIIGEISKNIKIDDINDDFLINLKIELDDKFDDGEKIEFEYD